MLCGSGRRTYSSLIDKALGRGIDRPSFSAAWGEYVEGGPVSARFTLGQGDPVIDRLLVVGEQIFGAKHSLEVEQTAEKIGLTARQLTGNDPCGPHQAPPARMLAVEDLLGGHQFFVELSERQLGWQNRVLNVVESVIAARHASAVAEPALGPRIGRVDADVDDFG